jgi:molybdenum cofactor cytidylyltransferase
VTVLAAGRNDSGQLALPARLKLPRLRRYEARIAVNLPAGNSLHVIVLAAGASRRFGSPKQLAQIDGRPLLQTAVARAVAVAGHAVTVVLGSGAAALTPLLRHLPASVLVNRDWNEGIGSSLRAGVAILPGSCDGVLVALADQVAVTTPDLQRLVAAWRQRPEMIVAAAYAGITGVPAVFPRWCFPALAGLRGDEGARLLLRRYADRVVRLPLPNAEIDIDLPEDLLAVEARRQGDPPLTE